MPGSPLPGRKGLFQPLKPTMRWLLSLRKQREQKKQPLENSDDSCIEDYSDINVVFPQSIVNFMRALKPLEPSKAKTHPKLFSKFSAVRIKQLIVECAKKLQVTLDILE